MLTKPEAETWREAAAAGAVDEKIRERPPTIGFWETAAAAEEAEEEATGAAARGLRSKSVEEWEAVIWHEWWWCVEQTPLGGLA